MALPASRVDRLFLLTNDDDFIPFCRTMKEYGANVSIIHLAAKVPKNISLLREADSYDVVHYTELLITGQPEVRSCIHCGIESPIS
jgi:uncharacterized LabA/DUF88 family protein